jgi:hypothetical protein
MEKEIEKSQKLISQITSQNIKPRPRWYFVFENYVFWGLFFLFLILGGLAFSIILYALTENDLDLLWFPFSSKMQFIIASLPFLWILFLVVFFFISVFGIRHTKKGYRYPFLRIFSLNLLLSVLLGSIFFYTGGAEKIERIFAQAVPIYKSVEEHKVSRWSNPESGFLSGIILEGEDEGVITTEDFEGKKWEIEIQEAVIRPRVSLVPGEKIKIIGQVLENHIFTAEEIRSWGGRQIRKE